MIIHIVYIIQEHSCTLPRCLESYNTVYIIDVYARVKESFDDRKGVTLVSEYRRVLEYSRRPRYLGNEDFAKRGFFRVAEKRRWSGRKTYVYVRGGVSALSGGGEGRSMRCQNGVCGSRIASRGIRKVLARTQRDKTGENSERSILIISSGERAEKHRKKTPRPRLLSFPCLPPRCQVLIAAYPIKVQG